MMIQLISSGALAAALVLGWTAAAEGQGGDRCALEADARGGLAAVRVVNGDSLSEAGIPIPALSEAGIPIPLRERGASATTEAPEASGREPDGRVGVMPGDNVTAPRVRERGVMPGDNVSDREGVGARGVMPGDNVNASRGSSVAADEEVHRTGCDRLRAGAGLRIESTRSDRARIGAGEDAALAVCAADGGGACTLHVREGELGCAPAGECEILVSRP